MGFALAKEALSLNYFLGPNLLLLLLRQGFVKFLKLGSYFQSSRLSSLVVLLLTCTTATGLCNIFKVLNTNERLK